MGSQFKPVSAGNSSLRLLNPDESTAINRLVEQLGFSNPEKAKAFLVANPEILGKSHLMPALQSRVDRSSAH